MIIQIDKYQIRPHPNKLCWELWEHREVRSRDEDGNELVRTGWVSQKRYPSTLPIALAHVHEMLLKEGREVVGLEEAVRVVEATRDRILAVERREIEG